MNRFKVLIILFAVLAIAAVAYAGNIHRDGMGSPMQVFTPTKGASVTHTKADVTYTLNGESKAIRFQPSAAISYKINGTGAAYPVTANTNEGPFGIGTANGTGIPVTSIVFSGISSAAKTIYIQEQ